MAIRNRQSTPPDPSGSLSTAQALWQESTDSVIIGTIERSSLLEDEARSQLNKLVTARVKAHAWEHVSFLEVNNVCDGGPELWEALKGML